MLKSQDVLVALALAVAQSKKQEWKQLDIAQTIGLSQAEVNNALKRLEASHLYRKESREINLVNLKEFVLYGLKYAFPAKLGAHTQGIPTAWGDEHVFGEISSKDAPVWSSIEGRVVGASVEPLFKSAPTVYSTNEDLYHLLCGIDAIRLGRSREFKVAKNYIEKFLDGKKRSS